MRNCLYCKRPAGEVRGTDEWEGFIIEHIHCKACGRAWKDFGGDVVLQANKEPPKELPKE